MLQFYLQTMCDILFLLAQRGWSSGGCGFALPARPPWAVLDPNAPSPFPLPRVYSTPSSVFFCPYCSSFSQHDSLLCASSVNPFIPLWPRSGAGGSCLGSWVSSKVKQHLIFTPSCPLPLSLH